MVECDLTQLQKQFYRAVYEQNAKLLLQLAGGKKKHKKKSRHEEEEEERVNTPSLMNIAMQLRHVCNHPYSQWTTLAHSSRSLLAHPWPDLEPSTHLLLPVHSFLFLSFQFSSATDQWKPRASLPSRLLARSKVCRRRVRRWMRR